MMFADRSALESAVVDELIGQILWSAYFEPDELKRWLADLMELAELSVDELVANYAHLLEEEPQALA